MKIVNDDCLRQLKKIPDNVIDLVITDPPYKLDNSGARSSKFWKKKHADPHIVQINNFNNGISVDVLNQLVRVMKRVNIYIWCSKQQIRFLLNYFKQFKCNYNLICWHKTNPIPACGNTYLSDTEYCLFFRQKGVKVYGSYKTKHTYYISPQNIKDKHKYHHPTVKPQNIIENFVINSSKQNDIILDPYMGSGTTGAASRKLGRRFCGFEINPKYFKTAKKRIITTPKLVKN